MMLQKCNSLMVGAVLCMLLVPGLSRQASAEGDCKISLLNTRLTIAGDSDDNDIFIRQVGDMLFVQPLNGTKLNGVRGTISYSFDPGSPQFVSDIDVRLGEGDDFLALESMLNVQDLSLDGSAGEDVLCCDKVDAFNLFAGGWASAEFTGVRAQGVVVVSCERMQVNDCQAVACHLFVEVVDVRRVFAGNLGIGNIDGAGEMVIQLNDIVLSNELQIETEFAPRNSQRDTILIQNCRSENVEIETGLGSDQVDLEGMVCLTELIVDLGTVTDGSDYLRLFKCELEGVCELVGASRQAIIDVESCSAEHLYLHFDEQTATLAEIVDCDVDWLEGDFGNFGNTIELMNVSTDELEFYFGDGQDLITIQGLDSASLVLDGGDGRDSYELSGSTVGTLDVQDFENAN